MTDDRQQWGQNIARQWSIKVADAIDGRPDEDAQVLCRAAMSAAATVLHTRTTAQQVALFCRSLAQHFDGQPTRPDRQLDDETVEQLLADYADRDKADCLQKIAELWRANSHLEHQLDQALAALDGANQTIEKAKRVAAGKGQALEQAWADNRKRAAQIGALTELLETMKADKAGTLTPAPTLIDHFATCEVSRGEPCHCPAPSDCARVNDLRDKVDRLTRLIKAHNAARGMIVDAVGAYTSSTDTASPALVQSALEQGDLLIRQAEEAPQ